MEFFRVSDKIYIMNMTCILCRKDLAQNQRMGGYKGTLLKCEILKKWGGMGGNNRPVIIL